LNDIFFKSVNAIGVKFTGRGLIGEVAKEAKTKANIKVAVNKKFFMVNKFKWLNNN